MSNTATVWVQGHVYDRLVLVTAFHGGVSVVSIATVVLVAFLMLLTAYAVPALMGGKM